MSGSALVSTSPHAPGPDAGAPDRVRTLRIGLLGHGTVGRAFADLVRDSGPALRDRLGVDLRVTTVLVRDAERHRAAAPPGSAVVDEPAAFESRAHDVVVEALGGIEPAHGLVHAALRGGTPVVTANKALLATYGDELLRVARAAGTVIRAEAAVAAAVPLLGTLQTALRGACVRRIDAVLNGTSNHLLTHIDRDGVPLAEALCAARAAGLCEADPALDVSGEDAAHKLRILLSVLGAPPCDPEVRGIGAVTPDDAAVARACGLVLRPVVHAVLAPGGTSAWIAPAAVSERHPLAHVDGAGNGVVLRADPTGEIVLAGPGAGGAATASALLDDVLAVTSGGRSYADPRETAPPAGGRVPDSEWLVTLGPATAGPDADRLLDFVAGEGLTFRRLVPVRLPGGPVVAGTTRPLPRPVVERALATLRTVGAARVARAVRVLPGAP